jgi:hypothetical protein
LLHSSGSVSATLPPPPPFDHASFLPPGYFFNKPCGNHMGTKFWEAVCDEHGIGGSGEYCGDNDAHLGRITVFYHEVLGGKYVPAALASVSFGCVLVRVRVRVQVRDVLFDLDPGVIVAATLSRRSASFSARVTS